MSAKFKLTAKFCLVFMLVSTLIACEQQDHEKLVLRVGHSLDSQHSVHKALMYMSERLVKYSHGTMSLKIYPSGQLGSEREMIELLQIGSLAMTKVSASPLEGFVPAMKVFSVPYIFRGNEHYWNVLNSEVGNLLLSELTPYRLHGLGYFDAGSRSFYTTERPIYTPDDLTGLKIRVLNSPTAVEMIRTLGAAATPVSWGELYTALQQGVVDGAENNPPSYYLSRHYEIANYLTLDEHTSVPDIVLCSKRIWDSLTTEQKKWLSMAMKDATDFQRKLWQSSTKASLEEVKSAGVEVIFPDKTVFARKVAPMHRELEGTPVGDILKRIEAM
tara:strand:+ start:7854 stop:8843 length:990 start_codon:yes stop_codon:yes gene_type:complete